MQRVNPDPNKSKISSYEKIEKNYFQPFIKNLSESGLNQPEIIRKIVCYLKIRSAATAWWPPMPDEDLPNPLTGTIKEKLFSQGDLHGSFKELCFVYTNWRRQIQEFPEYPRCEIQTCIRELFFIHLNPLPQMQIRCFNEATFF
jgi:hypothetical protein